MRSGISARTLSNRTRRIVVGAFVAAAVAAPLYAATASTDAQVSAQPKCLATVSVQGQPDQCAGYSNGQPIYAGTPDFGVFGPNSGSMPGGGLGVSTGPLLPGTSIQNGIG